MAPKENTTRSSAIAFMFPSVSDVRAFVEEIQRSEPPHSVPFHAFAVEPILGGMSSDDWYPFVVSHRLSGNEIKRRLGRCYCVLPSEREFLCRFHHLGTAASNGPGQADRQFPCEADDRLVWPMEARPGDLMREHLPLCPLPDNRWVWFLPDTERFGSILPHVWGPLLDTAKRARGLVVAHAYEVTLARLQAWKKGGASIKDYQKKRDAMRVSGGVDHQTIVAFEHENDPTGDSRRLSDWMAFWSYDLHQHPEKLVRPFETAFQMLSKVTGYRPSTIKSIVRREKEFDAVTPKPRGSRQTKSG